jgi:hypothetical protein
MPPFLLTAFGFMDDNRVADHENGKRNGSKSFRPIIPSQYLLKKSAKSSLITKPQTLSLYLAPYNT